MLGCGCVRAFTACCSCSSLISSHTSNWISTSTDPRRHGFADVIGAVDIVQTHGTVPGRDNQMRRKSRLRYIQYRKNQYTSITATPSINGSRPEPKMRKTLFPRLMCRLLMMKSSHRCAIRYAAIEFMPTTTSGNAQRRYCFTSMIHENAARNRKHTPPLKSVH